MNSDMMREEGRERRGGGEKGWGNEGVCRREDGAVIEGEVELKVEAGRGT